MLKERIEFDILTSLNDVKANTEDMIKKNISFINTVNNKYNFKFLGFVLEVFLLEPYQNNDDEGPVLSIDFNYPEIRDMEWDTTKMIIRADYGRPGLWFDMEEMHYIINEIDEAIYNNILNKITDFVKEFEVFIINEINNNY